MTDEHLEGQGSASDLDLQHRYPGIDLFPAGWYRVMAEREVTTKPQRVLLAGRYYTVFRTAGATVAMLPDRCPHLGASLSLGEVEGESIVCAFHKWKISADGHCLSMGKCSTKNQHERSVLAPVPTAIFGGQLVAYVGPAEKHWALPPFPDVGPYGLHEWRKVGDWRIRCHVQDIPENAVDNVHFLEVHAKSIFAASAKTTHVAAVDNAFEHSLEPVYVDAPFKGILPANPTIQFFAHGLGVLVTMATAPFGLNMVVVYYATPIDRQWTQLSVHTTLARSAGVTSSLVPMAPLAANVRQQVVEDLPIWNTREYLPKPMLGDGDGPILQFRRWSSRFYSNPLTQLRKPQSAAGAEGLES